MENNTNNKIFSNLIWNMAERYGAQIVQFVVSIVLARFLMPEIYGIIALVTIFITILQTFIDRGLAQSLIQKKDSDDLDFSTIFYFNIIFCAFLYLLIFLLAPLIATFYENNELTAIIRVLSIVIIFSSVKNVLHAYVSKNMQFKKFFLSTLIGTLVSAVVGIVMAMKGFGIWSLVAQNLTNTAIDTLVLWLTVKWRPKLQFSFQRLKQLFSYGWKLLLSAILDVLYNNSRQLIIGKKYSSEDLAYYNKGNTFPNLVVSNINTSINSVVFPVMSMEQDNKEKVRTMTKNDIMITSYIMCPMMIGLAVVGESVIKLLLTEKWLLCVPFMQIFCIDYMLYPIHAANVNAICALGRSDLFLRLEILKKIVGILFLLFAINLGPIAIAYSLLISSFVSLFINAYPNKELINYSFKEQIKDIIPNLLLSLLMGICVFLIGFIEINYIVLLFIQLIVGVIIYVLFSIVLKNKTFKYLISVLKKNNKKN